MLIQNKLAVEEVLRESIDVYHRPVVALRLADVIGQSFVCVYQCLYVYTCMSFFLSFFLLRISWRREACVGRVS